MLIRNSDAHSGKTCFNNMNMVCPKYIRQSQGGRTFTVRTIKNWNALVVSLPKEKSISTFKRRFYSQILINRTKSVSLISFSKDTKDIKCVFTPLIS
jgi:hypothetical protein